MNSSLETICAKYNIDPADVVYCFFLSDGSPRIILKDGFNDVYACLLDDDSRIQIVWGGRGSGKSNDITRRIVASNYSGHNWLVCRYYKIDLRNSVYNEILSVIDDWGLANEYTTEKNTMTITCKHNGRQILFGALEEPRRLKSIKPKRGVLTDIFMEEGDECPDYDSFNTLNNCLRGIDMDAQRAGLPQPKKRVILAFNPIPENHWMYRVFFSPIWHHPDVRSIEELKTQTLSDKIAYGMVDGAKVTMLKTTYVDNRFLTQDDIQQREFATGERLWVDTLGNFGRIGTTIFERGKNWVVADLNEMRSKGEIPPFKRNLYNGIDFGYNDPNVLIQCCLDKEKRRIYVYNEVYKKQCTTNAFGKEVGRYLHGQIVYCDNAEPDRIQELRELGIHADKCRKGKAKGAKTAKQRRIEWLHDYVIYVDVSCANLIDELKVYRWRTDSAGNVLDVPEDANDHGIDALSYALGYEIFPGMSLSGSFEKLF